MDLFEIESIREEMQKGPEFYTLQMAAEILKVNYITVYRLVVVGEIDGFQVGSCWRIPAAAIREYLERRHPFNRG